jgi:hypothetical protein
MRIVAAALLVFVALGISGCGKKARHLDPPDSSAPQYPKHYPPPDSSGANL